jgi:outer membrane lipoprotein carrier protein
LKLLSTHGRTALAALVALALVAFAPVARAGGVEQLHAFLSGAKSGKAMFKQQVVGRTRAGVKESSGTFTFMRPGKFRWAYETPFEQLIVGDGSKLWIYDRDLNQVIVRKLDLALGSSPAALLAGDNALEKHFDVTDGGRADGMELIDARPKSAESGFEKVRIGFRDNLPRMMELTDTFGNTTTLTFASFERNPPLDAALFAFVPPKGADVVGE